MRDWRFVYGKGAYRETDFDALYNKIVKVVPRTEFNKAAFIKDEYNNHELKHTEPFVYDVDNEAASQAVEYSYSYWYKFTWFPGTTDLGRLRGWWHSISGITEEGSYAGAGYGDRNLAIFFTYWGHSVGFHPTTYDLNCNENCGNHYKWVDALGMRNLQNSWTRIYMGYSHEKREVYAYFEFERSGNVVELEWTGIKHRTPSRLKFILGGLPHQYHGAPGYFNDIRVDWKKGAYIRNRADIQNYFKSASPMPTVFPKLKKTLYPLVEDRPLPVGRNDGARRFQEPTANMGAEEYAWWGWFKWEEPAWRDTWHIMMRLSLMENHIDASYLGDRTLNLWLNPNGEYLHFSTFNVQHNGGDDVNRYQNIGISTDDYSRWFWVYFGYNYQQEKAFAYVKTASGVKTLEWRVHHILPVYTTWYLAKDAWYAGFAGRIRKFTMAFG